MQIPHSPAIVLLALIKEKSKLIFTQKSVHKCLSSFHNIQKPGGGPPPTEGVNG